MIDRNSSVSTGDPLSALITAIGQTPRVRHPDPSQNTMTFLRDAAQLALSDAGLGVKDIDGLAVASFSLGPDHAVDLAWRMGLSVRWLLQDINGGVSGINMLGHAIHGIEAGAASHILVLAGDATNPDEFVKRAANYNSATRDHLAPLGYAGPNALFAMLTQRQMRKHGLSATDYGHLVITQRQWAAGNPLAAYRAPLSMAEYLNAPIVASPLRRYDCVPVVAGATAMVVSAMPPSSATGIPVRVLALRQSFNNDHQEGDGLHTGIRDFGEELWSASGMEPADMDVASVYDDYPAMAYAQLVDLGLIPGNDIAQFARERIGSRHFAVNTGGGMLSAGQAGGHDGGLQGVVEVVRQLQHRGGDRQVAGARFGVASGYGMVLYRYGAGAGAAVFQRAG
jgi:acetyl-CoA acetyltransferase